MERVTGVGGVFFRANDPEGLAAWYEQHLGVTSGLQGDMVWQQDAGPTVWAPFPQNSDYFPTSQQVMVNFRVPDLDLMLVQLRAGGVTPDGDVVEAAGVGRFAHFHDPAGTRFELWEPPKSQ